MEILAKIFGSVAKVKLMRLFLFNQESFFTVRELPTRTKLSSDEIRKEITNLVDVGLIKQKETVSDVVPRQKPTQKPLQKSSKKSATKLISKSVSKVKITGYSLNPKFPYLEALKNLLITVSLKADDTLTKKFAKAGKIKLFLASGVFLQEWNSRVDLLIVGDELNMTNLEKAISSIEAEIGKELSYSAFETEDFEYRVGIHDRLVRDILDSPHTVLIDRLGLTQQA